MAPTETQGIVQAWGGASPNIPAFAQGSATLGSPHQPLGVAESGFPAWVWPSGSKAGGTLWPTLSPAPGTSDGESLGELLFPTLCRHSRASTATTSERPVTGRPEASAGGDLGRKQEL